MSLAPSSNSDGALTRRPYQPARGELVDRKYRIEDSIGSGAMGIVMSARHVQLDERVAIKMLREDYAVSEEFSARFLREAQAMSRIRSEHVVRVIDVGSQEMGDEARPYLVMEYLEGTDLDTALSSRVPFDVTLAVDLVAQAIEAIAEAHSLGIVHRDLKPGNLFLTTRPDGTTCIKVLDFGISMITQEGKGAERITAQSAVMGSPAYMSPEQMRSTRNVDARTDIWSLGVILYEMLAGVAPFVGKSAPEVCMRVLDKAPLSMGPLRPLLPEGLVAAIARCLAKKPEDRFSTVAEMAAAIAPFGSDGARRSAESAVRVFEAAARASSAAASVDAPPSFAVHPAIAALGLATEGAHAPEITDVTDYAKSQSVASIVATPSLISEVREIDIEADSDDAMTARRGGRRSIAPALGSAPGSGLGDSLRGVVRPAPGPLDASSTLVSRDFIATKVQAGLRKQVSFMPIAMVAFGLVALALALLSPPSTRATGAGSGTGAKTAPETRVTAPEKANAVVVPAPTASEPASATDADARTTAADNIR